MDAKSTSRTPEGNQLFQFPEKYPELKWDLENFDSGYNTLTNITIYDDKERFINSFFENLYIWGTHINTKQIDSLSAKRNQAIEKIEQLIIKLNIVVSNVEKAYSNKGISDLDEETVNMKDKEITEITELTNIIRGLKSFITFCLENGLSEYEDNLIGNLIPINSGHNGILMKSTMENIILFMRNNKFI